MSDDKQTEKVQLHDAYAGGDPNITAGVYDNWAAEYEQHMKSVGYTHPAMTVAMYTRHQPAGDAPMLDAGSGTGIMAEILPALGYPVIDGFDISPGMLALAAKKNLYRNLAKGVLGERLDYADDTYAGCTASGVFTEGHAPLDGLDELCRVVKPGGHIVFSVARIYLGEQIEAKAKQLEDAGMAPRGGLSGQDLRLNPALDDKAIMAQIYAFQVCSSSAPES